MATIPTNVLIEIQTYLTKQLKTETQELINSQNQVTYLKNKIQSKQASINTLNNDLKSIANQIIANKPK